MKTLVSFFERLGVRSLLETGWNVAKLSAGTLAFAANDSTPPFAYQAMVRLYCLTGGYSNDFLSGVIRRLRPPYELPHGDGVLGTLDGAQVRTIVSDIENRGYHVFANRLPDALCDRLLAFARRTKSVVRAMDSESAPEEPVLYERAKPLGVRYDFREDDLVNDATVQELMADLSILSVAQAYLGCAPILDLVAMWWHTAFSKSADKTAAQFYHFDMDRIKWLKFFFYLTDVSAETGPHCFVEGSHRRAQTPPALLRQGYTRLGDAEVRSHFPPERFIEFTGPRGTIIAEDTRGLHKGKHVAKGDRLMFELEFTNSLFGGELPRSALRGTPTDALAALMRRHPRLFGLLRPATPS
ncbi:MAG TPA: phytanoyl-CoA dioxygenase family protein [Polyangia bacterium]|jgi:ectoine hydroxylase-related dioxygenase (phytanoyl-CoA dioxygenase family)